MMYKKIKMKRPNEAKELQFSLPYDKMIMLHELLKMDKSLAVFAQIGVLRFAFAKTQNPDRNHLFGLIVSNLCSNKWGYVFFGA